MRVLVIDNETKLLDELCDLIPGHETVRRWDTHYDDSEEFELVILSGSSTLPVMWNEDKYAKEFSLIKSRTLPLVGICLGAELIVRAFGGTLKLMLDKQQGLFNVNVIEQHHIFAGKTQFTASESHRWAIETLPPVLTPIAVSSHGVEVITHLNRPTFGFQFHPEVRNVDSDGRDIFLTLMKEIGLV